MAEEKRAEEEAGTRKVQRERFGFHSRFNDETNEHARNLRNKGAEVPKCRISELDFSLGYLTYSH